MFKSLPLVWAYLAYHKGKTVTLTICLTVAISLPVTAHLLVDLLQSELTKRAEATPLVIGPHGSRLDLVLHALYFHSESPGILRQSERFAIDQSGHAEAIPLVFRHRARGHPIVGTTLPYFRFRGLDLAQGRPLTRLGDCVVGWQVARTLGLTPGDRLRSDPENVFDLGGAYPMDMRVTGILARSNSPDDHSVFVDLRTAWILQGLGHGHDELSTQMPSEDILDQSGSHVVASPALPTHTRITAENVGSFHFHGDPADYPLTALIAVPRDERSATLLLGRYVALDSRYQALRPSVVVEELLGMVIQLKKFFDAQNFLMLAITALFISLVMLLSLRLRRQEMETLFHLGCSRGTMVILQAAELLILLCLSTALAVGTSQIALATARSWVQTLTG
jgi:putative ABC transport system permease protein